MGFSGPVGLDYSAVIGLAALHGVQDDPLSAALLAELLPTVEISILNGLRRED